MLKSPVGTLTFLMTDIEGSTLQWEEHPVGMASAILRHEKIINETVKSCDGVHVIEQGEGDSTLSVFFSATKACQAAQLVRDRLAAEPWPSGVEIKVRIGIHTGVADMRQQTYYGRVVNRAARVRAAANGGQIVLTRASRELLDSQLLPNVKDHGTHYLKDLLEAEHLYEISGPAPFPALRTLNHRPNNLPVRLTPFIGRREEIGQLRRKLLDSRLVTVLGSGGAGKTRLAIQTAAELIDCYPDGAFFADLTSLHVADDIYLALSRAIGLGGESNTDVRAKLASFLQDRTALLVFDNCEHLIAEFAQTCIALLKSSPGLRVLATSREALGIEGEHVYRLKTLSLPPETPALTAEEALVSEAVQLMCERIDAKAPDFRLTDSNAIWIARICRRLNGIPLAIELAAPRLKVLSAQDLCIKLENDFALLRGTGIENLRHQTMRAVIRQSYEPLSPIEKLLFRRLALFDSPWSSEAADALCGGTELEELGAIDVLESLYDKSLLQSEQDANGEIRCSYYELVREFAIQELIKDQDFDAAKMYFLGWAVRFAKRLEANLQNPQCNSVLLDFDSQLGSLRSSIRWAAETPALANRGLEVCVALSKLWLRRGFIKEARESLSHFINTRDCDQSLLADALNIFGVLEWYEGDLTAAAEHIQDSLRLWEQLGDQRKIASGSNNLGLIAVLRKNTDEARERFTSANRYFQLLNEHELSADCAVNLGLHLLEEGVISEALALFLEALATYPPRATWKQQIVHANLAEAYVLAGNSAEAFSSLLRSLDLISEGGDASRSPRWYSVASLICLRLSQPELAAQLLGASDRHREAINLVLNSHEIDLLKIVRQEVWTVLGEVRASDAYFIGHQSGDAQLANKLQAASGPHPK